MTPRIRALLFAATLAGACSGDDSAPPLPQEAGQQEGGGADGPPPKQPDGVVCGAKTCEYGEEHCAFCNDAQGAAFTCFKIEDDPPGCLSLPFAGVVVGVCDGHEECSGATPYCLWSGTGFEPMVLCGTAAKCWMDCSCASNPQLGLICHTIADCPPCATACSPVHADYPFKTCRWSAI